MATKLRVVWVNLAADTAAGLAYLHRKRGAPSLHPRNVLLDSMMAVKLTDYGRSPETLVHILESKSDDDDVGASQTAVQGEDSRLYMAPELLRFDTFDKEADLWSFGCLVVRMATMRRLYSESATDTSTHIVLLRVAVNELNPIDDLTEDDLSEPSPLFYLVRDCLEPNDWERPQADLVAQRLKQMTAARERRSTSVRPAARPLPPGVNRVTAVEIDAGEEEEEPVYLTARLARAEPKQWQATLTASQIKRQTTTKF